MPKNDNEQLVVKPSKWKNFKDTYFLVGSIDIPFLGLTIALLTIGLIMLFSASYPYAYYYKDSSYYYFIRQLIFAVGGLVGMFFFSKLNYKVLKALYKVIFFVTIGFLIVVLFYHTDFGDFKRWIPIGPFTFQPSDLAKFTIILSLSVYINDHYRKMNSLKYGIAIPVGIILIFCGLIYLEHHLSCTILMFLIGATLMFAGGTNWKLFAFGLAIIALVGFLVVSFPNLIETMQARVLKLGLIRILILRVQGGKQIIRFTQSAQADFSEQAWAIQSKNIFMFQNRKMTSFFQLCVKNSDFLVRL